MLARLRCFLLFQVWLAWQGGFFFYAAVVVPVGTDMLGSAAQGFVTQEVTRWLNVFGAVFHLLLAWTLAVERGAPHWRLRVGIGATSAAMLVALFALHPVLDSFLDPIGQTVDRPKVFYRWHNAYLWISTVQWLLALAMAWLWVGAWRWSSDRAGVVSESRLN